MADSRIKGRPFAFKGAFDVTNCETAADVISAANLNWGVDKAPVGAEVYNKDKFCYEYKTIPDAYAICRDDTNEPLGLVGGRYTPVQNIDAFNFFDNAIGKDKAIWQTAGSFGNGQRIFVTAKLPDNISVNGDAVDTYLVFTNSHDGKSGVKMLFTPIRVVCQNTLNAAIRTSTNYVSYRHTQSVHSKIDEAAEILGICKQKAVECQTYWNALSKMKMTDKQVADYITKQVLNDKEYENLINTGHTPDEFVIGYWRAADDAEISTRKMNVARSAYDYYFNGIGQKQIIGTAWGAVNAITGYYSNVDNMDGEKRMDSLLYGDRSNKIYTAFNDLYNNLKAA